MTSSALFLFVVSFKTKSFMKKWNKDCSISVDWCTSISSRWVGPFELATLAIRRPKVLSVLPMSGARVPGWSWHQWFVGLNWPMTKVPWDSLVTLVQEWNWKQSGRFLMCFFQPESAAENLGHFWVWDAWGQHQTDEYWKTMEQWHASKWFSSYKIYICLNVA